MTTDLTTVDPDSLDAIADRATHACIVFPEHSLPTGCCPDRADIGIEVRGGRFLLHVRAGTTYNGTDADLAEWVRTGTRSFADMADCVTWLRRPMAGAGGQTAGGGSAPRRAFELTDVTRVRTNAVARLTAGDLEAALRREVLGQDDAVRILSELAATHVARVRPRRPASALLVGPTGSGKTLAAQLLAEQLRASTGAPWAYHRLDMNEFSEPHTVARLFGSPPGYIGYGDGMSLASSLRHNPRSVVLFDEIDKAHPRLWHSLMNLMDAGRLAGLGRDLDARASVLLFTSNRDAAALQALRSASDLQLRNFLRERGYPPEIVARIGRVLPFRPLSSAVQIDLLVLTVQRVVDSFGLQLAHIEPEAVSALLRDAPLDSGGRDVEYFVERALASQLVEFADPTGVVSIYDGSPLRVVADERGCDE